MSIFAKNDTFMMISFIFSHSPLTGIVLLFIFIIAGIKHAFKNMVKEAEAYNKKHGKQEEKEDKTEKEDDEIIEISNPWSENRMYFAIASYDKKTKIYQAYVYHVRESTIVDISTRSKEALEKEIDETYKKFDGSES